MATYKEQVYKGWSEGLTAKEISEKYSINKTTVWTNIRRMQLKTNKHQHPLSAEIAELRSQGRTLAYIASKYGMSIRNVASIYSRYRPELHKCKSQPSAY